MLWRNGHGGEKVKADGDGSRESHAANSRIFGNFQNFWKFRLIVGDVAVLANVQKLTTEFDMLEENHYDDWGEMLKN